MSAVSVAGCEVLSIAGRDALAGFAARTRPNGGHTLNWQSQAMITAPPRGRGGQALPDALSHRGWPRRYPDLGGVHRPPRQDRGRLAIRAEDAARGRLGDRGRGTPISCGLT